MYTHGTIVFNVRYVPQIIYPFFCYWIFNFLIVYFSFYIFLLLCVCFICMYNCFCFYEHIAKHNFWPVLLWTQEVLSLLNKLSALLKILITKKTQDPKSSLGNFSKHSIKKCINSSKNETIFQIIFLSRIAIIHIKTWQENYKEKKYVNTLMNIKSKI